MYNSNFEVKLWMCLSENDFAKMMEQQYQQFVESLSFMLAGKTAEVEDGVLVGRSQNAWVSRRATFGEH